jgi:type I site-specific restriction endonuclease
LTGGATPSSGFWASVAALPSGNEAEVERRIVVPLLEALGYDDGDIRSKHPVIFHEGRRGRKPEADFVVFYGPIQSRDTSLLVVEAKAPGEDLHIARLQAESYASKLRAPFILITDGRDVEIWQLQLTSESHCALKVQVECIGEKRGELETLLSKEAMYQYCQSLLYKKIVPMVGDLASYAVAEINRLALL